MGRSGEKSIFAFGTCNISEVIQQIGFGGDSVILAADDGCRQDVLFGTLRREGS
jgi:hypothetical protein